MELSRRALSRVYELIKERITSLTSRHKHPTYINARNIATAMFYYILLVEGVGRALYYDYDKLDPYLALLFSLNEKFIEYSNNWEKYLLNK